MTEQDKKFNQGKFDISLALPQGNVLINSEDIIRCFWVEDIFSFCMVGRLTIIDRYGLRELAPLTGDEYIKIIWGRENTIEQDFVLHKINRASQITGGSSGASTEILDLFFVDKIFDKLSLKRYSLAWNDKNIGDIVKDISNNLLNISTWRTWEQPKEKLKHFYLPYWTPGEALVYLLKRGSGSKTNTPGYVMYQNQFGYNFCTLDKLLQERKSDPSNFLFHPKNLFYRNKILRWSLDGRDKLALGDIAGGNRLGWDPEQKELLFRKGKYSELIKKFTMLGRKTLFKDLVDDETAGYKVEAEQDPKILDNILGNDFIKRYMHQNIMKIIVPVNEERYCGQIIEVEWPSTQQTNKFDKNLSGLYLVKSITHQVHPETEPQFLQKMILIKNAYGDSDAEDLESASKMNLGGARVLGRG